MKTQKITKAGLRALYFISCESWKKQIAELILFQDGDNIEVENELILKAHSEANADQKKVIEKYFKIISDDVFSITTYSEVCKRLGIKELTIKDFENFGEDALKQLSFHKIKNLERFYNGNWKPNWKDEYQYKYYPYFTINSSSSLDFNSTNYDYDNFNENVEFNLPFNKIYKPYL